MTINTVTVIGANGAMGCNIAGIFASFGECKVYMVARNKDKAESARKKAAMSVKGETVENNLIPASYSEMESCIKESDIIFESVAENIDLKREIHQLINQYADDHQIICTGTSGISVNRLSECFKEELKKRFLGVHFFNPPYNMTLCEMIPGKHTDKTVVEELKEYLSEKLLRTIVQVEDSPAFLGNRIGFQFINEAIVYAEKYKYSGGIDYIDAILGQFTGRSMAPIVTADFVGLDVHKAIVDNIYASTNDYAHETFKMPDFLNSMIAKGDLGRKTGKGLYQTVKNPDGTKKYYVYDILKDTYREKYNYSFPFAEDIITSLRVGDYNKAFKDLLDNRSEEAEICVGFLVRYVIYALKVTKEIGDTIAAADDVMATGFNWIPPLAVIDAFGGENAFLDLCKSRLDTSILNELDICSLISDLPKSEYDYRRFFRAKH